MKDDDKEKKNVFFFFFLDFLSEIMSNKSYALPIDSKDELQVTIPIKEPVSPSTSESLYQRYVQIAIAVALYW